MCSSDLVIYERIERFLLFAFRRNIEFGNDLNGAVRAGQFTRRASGAAVFVGIVVNHHHFPAKTLRQIQRIAVLRIVLRDDLLVVGEIIPRLPHTGQQRTDRPENCPYVIDEERHRVFDVVLRIRSANPSE